MVQLHDQPLLGPLRPNEVADNFTPTDSWISYLLCMVKHQTSIVEEQNRRIAVCRAWAIKEATNPSLKQSFPTMYQKGKDPLPVQIQIS